MVGDKNINDKIKQTQDSSTLAVALDQHRGPGKGPLEVCNDEPLTIGKQALALESPEENGALEEDRPRS